MTSRAFYHQTSDGCLEKEELVEQKNAQSLQFLSTRLMENSSDVNMENGQDWFEGIGRLEIPDAALEGKCGQESLVESQQWQEMPATGPSGNISSQAFLEDALFGLDDTMVPMSALIDPGLGGSSPSVDSRYEDLTQRFYHGYSSSSISEDRELQSIATPSYVPLDATTIEEEMCYSLEPETEVCYKTPKSSTASEGGNTKRLDKNKKHGHNAIEKRYRTRLNEKIAILQQCLPSMRTPLHVEQVNGNTEEDKGPGLYAAQKHTKAAVLKVALEYITLLQENIGQLNSKNTLLKTRITAFEKLVSPGR